MGTYGFTLRNWKLDLLMHPSEDSLVGYGDEKRTILGVADGVTRDPCEVLPSSPWGKAFYFSGLKYPNPSPAKIAATKFLSTARRVLLDHRYVSEGEMKLAFEEGNNSIRELWPERMPFDYLTRDFPGTVGALLHHDKKTGYIVYGFIADSGIGIVKSNGKVLRTPNEGPDKADKYMDIQPEPLNLTDKGLTWNNPEVRKIKRGKFRNKDPKAFGVLTGEHEAMEFVRTGIVEYKPGYMALAFTDGLERILFGGVGINEEESELIETRLNSEIISLIQDKRAIKKYCRKKVITEGTLVFHRD